MPYDDDSLLDDPQTPSVSRARSQSKSVAPDANKTMSRDDMLRQELANVRKVNETIEGVLRSLDRTKSNMKVRFATNESETLTRTDRQYNDWCSFTITQYMDSHPLTDRTQSKINTGSVLAGSKSRHCRYRR